MAQNANRKRTRKNVSKERRGHSLWGSLFHREEPAEEEENILRDGSYTGREAEEEEGGPVPVSRGGLLMRLWHRINIWGMVAVSLFLGFTFCLLWILIKLWVPQNLSDISGYNDTEVSRDLTALIRNANGGPVTITEAELNRYLRDTCRMRQTGIFSIITHCHGIALRIHNGYVELIFDRLLGANFHQTTAVYLTFTQEEELGTPVLHVDLHGGEPLLGSMPNGGSVGSLSLPQKHVLMLKPALESLLTCYPDIYGMVQEYHYCPIFKAEGNNRTLTLIPYSQP